MTQAVHRSVRVFSAMNVVDDLVAEWKGEPSRMAWAEVVGAAYVEGMRQAARNAAAEAEVAYADTTAHLWAGVDQ